MSGPPRDVASPGGTGASPEPHLSRSGDLLSWQVMAKSLSVTVGGQAIVDLLATDDRDSSRLVELLFGTGLPPYAAAGDDISERIMVAVRELRSSGVDSVVVRVAVAERLARLVDAAPETDGSIPARGDLLFSLYRLAHKITVPPRLHAALKRAIEREEGRRQRGEPALAGPDYRGRPARAFLFDAAVVNQTDSGLKDFWLQALEDVGLRAFWDVSWRDARGGIRFMPDLSSGQPRPSLSGIAKSLRLIALNIEGETQDPAKRLARFCESIDQYCSAWPNQIERDDITPLTVIEYCPEWCRGVLANPALRKGRSGCTSVIQASVVGVVDYDSDAFWRDGDTAWLQRQIAALQLDNLQQRRGVAELAYPAVRFAEWDDRDVSLAQLLAKARAQPESATQREITPASDKTQG
jgi:hypothetical protein